MEKITCLKCGAVIGEIVNVEGLEMLKVGGMVLKSLHGICDCGSEIHWTVDGRMLSKLVERVKERTK